MRWARLTGGDSVMTETLAMNSSEAEVLTDLVNEEVVQDLVLAPLIRALRRLEDAAEVGLTMWQPPR